MDPLEEKSKKADDIARGLREIESDILEITSSKLTVMGKEYNLGEWITLKDYAVKYNITMSNLSMWIKRNVVPNDSIIVIPELNHMKLVKDQPYETRANS